MKRLLLAAATGAFLASSLPLNAAIVSNKFSRGDLLPGSPSEALTKTQQPLSAGFTVTQAEGRMRAKSDAVFASKKDEQTFEVKCVFKYDPVRYRPYEVESYNADGYYTGYYDYENDYVILEMAPGIYDFRAEYFRASSTSMFREEGRAYLILEDIEVSEDMEIEMDASLITECISFETYNPDGEKTALRNIRYINENYDFEIISEGNVWDFYCDNFITHCDYGIHNMHTNAGQAEVEPGPCGEWRSEWASNIYVNPVSDKYQIAQMRLLITEEECWIVPMFADGSNSQIVTNRNDKYSGLTDVSFAKTPAGEKCEIESTQPYAMYWGMSNSLDLPIKGGLLSSSGLFHHVRYCNTSTSMFHPEYHCFMKYCREDSAEEVDRYTYYDDEGNVVHEEVIYSTQNIDSPYFMLGYDSHTVFPEIDNRMLKIEPGGETVDRSFQSAMSFEVQPGNVPVFGSTPQYMRFHYLIYDSPWYDYPVPMLSYDSYGYYGDCRTSKDMEVSVRLNGALEASSWDEIGEWQMKCASSQMEAGEMEFRYRNDNIGIDGLPGFNTARVLLDTSKDDSTAPLIQSVQFRDGLNCVTERLKNVEGASLLIAGGDFQEKIADGLSESGEKLMWYEIEDCDIRVEYAPYGSNDFSEIDMTFSEGPLTGFGNLYSGSLENIDRCSATGWFDLRIVMTDAAGNTQEQIISPAFRVDSLTGIQAIGVNESNLRVLNSRVVSDDDMPVEVFTLSGQRVENEKLPAGLYVARSGKSVAKLMVK